MALALGLWDRLFGKRVLVEHTGRDGRVRTVPVTQKWLAHQKENGAIRDVTADHVRVHLLDPMRGAYEAEWRVGVDVAADVVGRLLDANTDSIHAIVTYEAGQQRTSLCDRATWQEARKSFGGGG